MRFYKPHQIATFAPLPSWLCRADVCSIGAKVVYARLLQYADDSGVAYPRQEVLAAELSLSVRQVQRYLCDLEEAGLIVSIQRGLCRSNEYRFPVTKHMDMDAGDDVCVVSDTTYVSLPKTSDVSLPLKEQNTRTLKRDICPPPTVEDIAAYMKERGWVDVDFNAKKFHDYYAADDWKMRDGKKVKNWKRCVITWEQNDPKRVKPTQEKAEIQLQGYDPSRGGLFK